MTKAEVIAEISGMTGKDQKEIAPIIEAFIKTVNQTMGEGKNIYIRGFGTFEIILKKEKKGRNISKKTEVVIPAHFAPTFTFCKLVKNRVKNRVTELK